jgi:hypothetical protein
VVSGTSCGSDISCTACLLSAPLVSTPWHVGVLSLVAYLLRRSEVQVVCRWERGRVLMLYHSAILMQRVYNTSFVWDVGQWRAQTLYSWGMTCCQYTAWSSRGCAHRCLAGRIEPRTGLEVQPPHQVVISGKGTFPRQYSDDRLR